MATKVFKPLGDGAYQRLIVDDPAPYLENGYYLSVADHQEPVAVQEKKEKPKSKPRKKKED